MTYALGLGTRKVLIHSKGETARQVSDNIIPHIRALVMESKLDRSATQHSMGSATNRYEWNFQSETLYLTLNVFFHFNSCFILLSNSRSLLYDNRVKVSKVIFRFLLKLKDFSLVLMKIGVR